MTIGLIWLVAIMQTKWTTTGNVFWYKLTRFFGKIFLINFAAGVVTGIVQEFQFGMNWSEYSRFVGDIFGAPLALEALIAFFMESTFVGLWIFGWNKLPKKVHLATVYLTAAGSTISAIFILAANCFMQNPVGATYNMQAGRAELVSLIDLITNPFFLVTFPHVIAGAFLLAGGMVILAAGWWLAKTAPVGKRSDTGDDHMAWRTATRFGAWFVLGASLVSILSGHFQAQVEAKYQPLKLAASEGLVDKSYPDGHAPFAIVAFFSADGTKQTWALEVPSVLSMLVDYKPSTPVKGFVDNNGKPLLTQVKVVKSADGTMAYALPPTSDVPLNTLQTTLSESQSFTVQQINPPNVWVSFYSFRVMVLASFLLLLFSILILVRTKEGTDPKPTKGWTVFLYCMPLIPLVAASAGWLLTEIGRQPWIVYGVLPTSAAVSPTVSGGEVLVSMILYTLIYAVVAVIVVNLFRKTIREGLPGEDPAPSAISGDAEDAVLHFAY